MENNRNGEKKSINRWRITEMERESKNRWRATEMGEIDKIWRTIEIERERETNNR